ncbi:MAG: multidrug transporter permease [Dehalococcoidia bacterium]|nr:multidrug transporter permease [Dehalococcoidia bacterium]
MDRISHQPLGLKREVLNFFGKAFVICELEVRKLRHDYFDLISRAVQPAFWLLIFGPVFTRIRVFPTGTVRYIDFMAPGVLAQSCLFISIFYGIAMIWERDMGILNKLLVSPIRRPALVLGKALSASVRALAQACIVFILAAVLGIPILWNPLYLAGVIAAIILGSVFFASLSMTIASLVKTRERFMGLNQILTMPLFFASNALYPIDVMPAWLKAIAVVNPLSYQVNLLRSLMITGDFHTLIRDFVILTVLAAAAVAVGSILYQRVLE